MNAIAKQPLLSAQVWRGDQVASAGGDTLPTGFATLDAELPGGGWPRGAITEIMPRVQGIGELRVLLPAMERLTTRGEWVALIAPPYIPYAPALERMGIDLRQLMVLETRALKDQWWAAEQALRAGSLGMVMFWPESVDDRLLRRLQTAARTGNAAGFIFTAPAHAAQPSPAPLRIALSAAGNALEVTLLKRRGRLLAQPICIPMVEPCTALDPPAARPQPAVPIIATRTRPTGPRLTKQHANGSESKRIWERVMSRNDEVKR